VITIATLPTCGVCGAPGPSVRFVSVSQPTMPRDMFMMVRCGKDCEGWIPIPLGEFTCDPAATGEHKRFGTWKFTIQGGEA
jgi:hypothetical protein